MQYDTRYRNEENVLGRRYLPLPAVAHPANYLCAVSLAIIRALSSGRMYSRSQNVRSYVPVIPVREGLELALVAMLCEQLPDRLSLRLHVIVFD